MSPIPSVVTAFALSSTAPSVAPDPGSVGQSASVPCSHLPHVLAMGGLLFAMVAVVSIAGYFHRGRGTVNTPGTGNTWTSFTGFLSAMRRRGPTKAAVTTAWSDDLEPGLQHVNMIYARYFHPTFWNLVECHPATPSAPAIRVEDEADEVPASEPKPFGKNSFLSMDDDDDDYDDGEGNENDRRKVPAEKRGGTKSEFGPLPPYDTSSSSRLSFISKVIGATDRQGAFLAIPGVILVEPEADPMEDSDTDSEPDFDCSPYDGIEVTAPLSISSKRRHGIADMAHFTRSLKAATAEESHGLIPTVSFRSGLCGIGTSDFLDADQDSCESLDRLDHMGNRQMSFSVCADHEGCRIGSTDEDSLGVPHESADLTSLRTAWLDVSELLGTDFDLSSESWDDGLAMSSYNPNGNDTCDRPPIDSCDGGETLGITHASSDLMRELLSELRNPGLEGIPRAFYGGSDREDGQSVYTDSVYSDDDEGEASIEGPCDLPSTRRNSIESISSDPRTDTDLSDEGAIYPLTPPLEHIAMVDTPDVDEACILLPDTLCVRNKSHDTSPPLAYSPPPLPDIRTHKRNRSCAYAPRYPLAALRHF